MVPSTEDVAIYLLILPLTIFLAVLGANWLWQRRKARLAAPPVVAGATAASATSAPAPATLHTLKVIAAEVVTPLGEELGAIAEALQAAPIPPLDTALYDANGFPLATRRCADIDLTLLPPAWQQDEENQAPNVAKQRALALLAGVVGRLGGVLTQLAAAQTLHIRPRQPQRAAELNPAWLGDAAPESTDKAQSHQRVPTLLRVQLLLEPGLDEAGNATVLAWLHEQLAPYGLTDAQLQMEIRAMSANSLAKHLNAIVDELAAFSQPVVVLLLAADSSVCQQSLNEGLLGDDVADRAGMHFPGEAAAALLLANAAFDMADCPTLAQLGMADLAECEPIARTRPHAAKALLNLFALQTHRRTLPVDIGWLCTGLALGPEATEAASLLAVAPTPLQMNEVLHLRSVTGDAGIGGRLTGYALASQMVAQQSVPTLLVLNDGWLERGLCLLETAPEQPAPPAADT
ncbi:hypothetical protein FG002_017905 [Chitinimonas sp. BJB300]|nr:hypothetical protein FG002_017905 [Chitinimonas sp. BJB300]